MVVYAMRNPPRFESFLREHDVTQVEVARVLGLTAATVSRKLGGEIRWNVAEANAIVAHFRQRWPDLTLDELFGDQVESVSEEVA